MKKLILIAFTTFCLIEAYAQNYDKVIKVVASDREENDYFGFSVSISGDYAIVGAYAEDEDLTGADSMTRAGSAYLFERDTIGNWNQVQKIVTSDRAANNHFGWSVSISGNYSIVGAFGDSTGSAYVFERDGSGSWNQIQKIVASDRAAGDGFGFSVSIEGNYVIVGASGEDEDALGGSTMLNSGSAYIFERDTSGNWNEEQKIVASDRETSDAFGMAVDISNNYAIVGAYQEDEDAMSTDSMSSAGSAYVFERDGSGNWNEVQKIVALDRAVSDVFGRSVSISGDYAIVGAFLESEDDTGGNTMNNAGSAYLFERDTIGNWTQVQKLVASDRRLVDYFGISVSISGNYAIIGANIEDEDAIGGGTMFDAGSAYVFERDSIGNWDQMQKIVASDRDPEDQFGYSVSISSDYAIVGAPFEDEDTKGADSIRSTGSAYLFEPCISTSKTINPIACDSFVSPSGNYIWTLSSTYIDTIPNTAGCDSVITVSLTINNSTSETIDPIACDKFTSPSGNYIWTSSSTYIDTISNSAGCDSIITVNLTIKNSTSKTINPIACGSYVSPSGKYTWTTSSTYMDTIPNSAGCDSVITVNLTINNTVNVTINPTSCEIYISPSGNYMWANSGIYMDTVSMPGCDSFITVNLTINNNTSETINPVVCNSYVSPSGKYTWTTSGIYMDTILNMDGCDSIITINLAINTVDVSVAQAGPTLTANATGATYQWLNCDSGDAPIPGETMQVFIATANGNYAVEVTQSGCVDTSSCYEVTGVGILENDFGSSLSVYPNPTEGKLNIDLGRSFKGVSITTSNIAGQIISNKYLGTTRHLSIDLEGTAGYYMVEVQTSEGKSATLKILKE